MFCFVKHVSQNFPPTHTLDIYSTRTKEHQQPTTTSYNLPTTHHPPPQPSQPPTFTTITTMHHKNQQSAPPIILPIQTTPTTLPTLITLGKQLLLNNPNTSSRTPNPPRTKRPATSSRPFKKRPPVPTSPILKRIHACCGRGCRRL